MTLREPASAQVPRSKPIRPAATLLILRDAPQLEVFMVQRPADGSFPNLHVFPGGKVEEADADVAHLCVGLDDGRASQELGIGSGGLRYWVAAIRECFEECGVLLAYREGGLFAARDAGEAARFEGYRDALMAERLALDALLRAEGLRLATDRMLYVDHWLTPPPGPARFDTRFFAAALPAGQRAFARGSETPSGEWVAPRTALARAASGEREMVEPTLAMLDIIAGYDSVGQALRGVRERDRSGGGQPD